VHIYPDVAFENNSGEAVNEDEEGKESELSFHVQESDSDSNEDKGEGS